jgi:2-polyprenyl-3-methyl-5-hydroxy-6-metoxy-1,4-benzoquinol methylase
MELTYFVERKQCPVCRSTNHRERVRVPYDAPALIEHLRVSYAQQGTVEFKYLEAATYVLRECTRCGLVFQAYVPNDVLMERIYEHWIDAQYCLRMQMILDEIGLYSKHAQEVMQIVAWRNEGRSGLKVLDFGMGWAKWAMMAQAFGCDVWGCELSKTRIEFARAHGIRVLAGEELPHRRFDFINAEQVFEHLPDPLDTLRMLRSALTPGGMIKISVPDGHDIDRRLAALDWSAPRDSSHSLMPVAPLEHLNCFRRETFVHLAREAGMVEVRMPLRIQYAYATNWNSLRNIARNLIRPLVREMVAKRNYVFMAAAGEVS